MLQNSQFLFDKILKHLLDNYSERIFKNPKYSKIFEKFNNFAREQTDSERLDMDSSRRPS